MTLANIWNNIIDEIIVQCKAITVLNDSQTNNGFNATTSTSSTGTLYAVQFTGLTPGEFIDSFDLKINVAAGNVRVSLYGDVTNSPDQLLGESNSIAVNSTGVVNFRLSKQVEVPQDGIVWCAYENDDGSLDLDLSTGQSSGTLYTVAHTFGSAPDPFSGSAGTSPFWVQLHYNPKVVKHYGVAGAQPEDYHCIVSADNMTSEERTTRGTNNIFTVNVDIIYKGVDFQDALSKILDVSSEVYDNIHYTNLNNTVHNAVVEIQIQDIVEGDNLYLAGVRCIVSAEKLVIQ